ncbi:MAG: hypothetical protein OEZ65_13990 [Gemmatimonadota bacterium]|nr:hypothetical protein [Gemmatimonadota bacterium]MDH5760695.1 hypothetical protein [Gemmatimonadota bacterium]
MHSLRPLAFTLVLMTGAAPAASQSRGYLPRLLELPASTRAMALGDSYTFATGHADAVFYQPALIHGASGFGLDIQLWSGEATSAAFSAAMERKGGTVAMGLATLQYRTVSERGSDVPGGGDHLFSEGPVAASERVASIGFTTETSGFRFGFVGKVVEERLGTMRNSALGVDLGMATDVGPLGVSLAVQNVGHGIFLGRDSVSMPRRLTLGAGGYGMEFGPLDLGASAALSYRVDGEIIPSGGIEVGYWPVQGRTFIVRMGMRRIVEGVASPFTLGFAFEHDELTLEWTLQDFEELGERTHRLGIRWK